MWDFPDLTFSLTEPLSQIAQPLPLSHSRHVVAHGDRGTEQTIEFMQQMVGTWKRSHLIRTLVGNILWGGKQPDPTCPCLPTARACQDKDYMCYAEQCYKFAKDGIIYAYDPHQVEYIESPLRLLQTRIGDCDSKDMLLCAMFEQLGLQSQFVTIKADMDRPNDYSHVYTRVKIPNVGWVAADPTMPKWFGWEPEGSYVKRYWPGSTDEAGTKIDDTPSVAAGMGGLGGLGLTFKEAAQWTGVGGVAVGLGMIYVAYKFFSLFKRGAKRTGKAIGSAAKPAARVLAEAAIRKKFGVPGGP